MTWSFLEDDDGYIDGTEHAEFIGFLEKPIFTLRIIIKRMY